MNHEELMKKQETRYLVLNKMYALYEENSSAIHSLLDVGKELELSHREIEDVYDYLSGEGLLEIIGSAYTVKTTHYGRVEIEQSIMNPEAATDHFPIQIINTTVYGHVGAIQNAPGNVHVNQNIGFDINEVMELFNQIRREIEESLAENLKEEALELLLALETQAKAEKQSNSGIKTIGKALTKVLKDVAVDITSEVIVKMVSRP